MPRGARSWANSRPRRPRLTEWFVNPSELLRQEVCLSHGTISSLRLQSFQQVDHLDGRQGGVGPLVARLEPGSIECLLHGFGGKDAEDDRDAGLQSGLHDSGGGLAGNV